MVRSGAVLAAALHGAAVMRLRHRILISGPVDPAAFGFRPSAFRPSALSPPMADAQAYGLPAEIGVPSAGSDLMKDASHSTHTHSNTTHARAHPCTRAPLPSARSDPPNPLRPDDRLREEESEKAPFDSELDANGMYVMFTP